MIQNKKCEDSHNLSNHTVFYIKNLGQIKNAIVNLKDLNIIMGHNSTSKTYLTHTIYGFYKFLLNTMHLLFYPAITALIDNKNYTSNYLMYYGLQSPYFIDGLSTTILSLKHIEIIKHQQVENLKFAIPLSDIEEAIYQDLNHLAEYYVKNCLVKDLAIDPELTDVLLNDCSLQMKVNSIFNYGSMTSEESQEQNDEANDQFAHMSFQVKDSALNITITNESEFIKEKTPLDYDRVSKLLSTVVSQIWHHVANLLFLNPFVISADRANLPLFYKEIDANRNNLIRSMQASNSLDHNNAVRQLLQNQTGRYSQAVHDNIDFIRDLTSLKEHYLRVMNDSKLVIMDYKHSLYLPQQWLDKYQSIADYLSQEINHGSYEVDENVDQLYFIPLNQNSKIKIPIHNVSSSIKALLILDFYVKYVLPLPNAYRKALIIDEPELSLHPDNQRKIARLIAMIVNTGVQVICTTHSDFFIHEFNNLIMLSNNQEDQLVRANEEEKDQEIYSKDMVLDADRISCYEATTVSGNFEIKMSEIKIDEYGIEDAQIDKEGDSINKMAYILQSGI